MLPIVDFNPLKGDYNRLMTLSYYLGWQKIYSFHFVYHTAPLGEEKSFSQRAFLYLTKYMLKLVAKNNIML